VSRCVFIWILGCLVAGCRFDPSGITTDGALSDTAIPDGETDGLCPEPLRLSLSIGGVTEVASPDQPFVRALVGDVIELSAAGSCAQEGTLSYQWQVSPVDSTRTTAEPDLSSETLTIYPILAREYVVSLTVSNGTDSLERTVLGIAAHGWIERDGLPGGEDVRDLATGRDSLWIAHKDGAFRLPLGGAPPDQFIAVNSEAAGESIGANLGTVYYSAESGQVWFGQAAMRGDVWRVDLDQPQAVVARVAYDHAAALGRSAEVLAIEFAAPGVALATDQGLTLSADGVAFAGGFQPAGNRAVHAFAAGNGRHFAGSRRLYDLDAEGVAHAPFDDRVPDHRIRALVVDSGNEELWIGSADSGVARAASTGAFAVQAVYGSASGTLATDAIRDLVVETSGAHAGDVWAATDAGVARYVRARDTWLLMGNNQGLSGFLDVRAIAIDDAGGRRAIYAGTRNGLVSLHAQ
jgi:hypothetical protein